MLILGIWVGDVLLFIGLIVVPNGRLHSLIFVRLHHLPTIFGFRVVPHYVSKHIGIVANGRSKTVKIVLADVPILTNPYFTGIRHVFRVVKTAVSGWKDVDVSLRVVILLPCVVFRVVGEIVDYETTTGVDTTTVLIGLVGLDSVRNRRSTSLFTKTARTVSIGLVSVFDVTFIDTMVNFSADGGCVVAMKKLTIVAVTKLGGFRTIRLLTVTHGEHVYYVVSRGSANAC